MKSSYWDTALFIRHNRRTAIWVSCLLVAGCASAPKKVFDNKTKGQWEAKLQIQDLKENKSYNLDMDVMAEKPNSLRAEISGTLGVAVASLLVKDKEVSYALHRSKRFYSGKTNDNALLPVLQVSFDPSYLLNLFFDEPIRSGGWSCLTNPDHLVESCVREGDKLLVQWQERNGENKRVLVRGANFEIQLVVKNFIAEPANLEKAFKLDPPANYKLQKID